MIKRRKTQDARHKTLIGVTVLCTFFLIACKGKEKALKNTLIERDYSASLNYQQQKNTLTLDYFGDKLSGQMSVADSTDLDSATFESNGIKLKLKTTKNKKGGKDIGFTAEAKPVARSKLTQEDTKLKATEEQGLKGKIKEQIKVKNKTSFGGWGWLIAIIVIAVVVYLLRRAIKLKSWI